MMLAAKTLQPIIRRITQTIVPSILLAMFLSACHSTSTKKSDSNSPLDKEPILKYTEAIEKDPQSASAYFDRGRALESLNIDTLAIYDYLQAAKLDSTKAEYMSAIGALMFDHKDISGSKKWLEKALQLNPNDIESHLRLAKLMVFSGDHMRALAEINTVLRNDAYNPDGYFLKGLVYRDMQDTGKAISSFQTCINVAPNYKDAMIQLAQIYNRRNDPLGLRYLDNAYKIDTTDLFPLYAKGMYFQEQKKYEEAKEVYKRIILNDPQYADALFAMGYILLQQDSFANARRQFDLVTKVEPNNANAYCNRALCSELLNEKDKAIADYKQALTFDANSKTAQEGLKRLQ